LVPQYNDQIIFRYCDEFADDPDSNPMARSDNIAEIINKQRNVLGMMPHPERSATDTRSQQDGRRIFEALESLVG
jgi:phosphoribosylformylglycinamidine synthase